MHTRPSHSLGFPLSHFVSNVDSNVKKCLGSANVSGGDVPLVSLCSVARRPRRAPFLRRRA